MPHVLDDLLPLFAVVADNEVLLHHGLILREGVEGLDALQVGQVHPLPVHEGPGGRAVQVVSEQTPPEGQPCSGRHVVPGHQLLVAVVQGEVAAFVQDPLTGIIGVRETLWEHVAVRPVDQARREAGRGNVDGDGP